VQWQVFSRDFDFFYFSHFLGIPSFVIPAQAGIQFRFKFRAVLFMPIAWIPACAGMTGLVLNQC
jgi:hypothetical protein